MGGQILDYEAKDITRASTDSEARHELYKEFHLI